MARFSSAPVEEVLPQRSARQPSKRAQIQTQYQEALREAVLEKREALVVQLEPEDKALTIRNRIKRAAELLGVEDIVIRLRRDRVIAFSPSGTVSEG